MQNMAILPKQHTFAAQLATQQGYEFYCGPNRILYEPGEFYKKVIFPTKENFTRIHAYLSAHRKARIIETISSYDELKKLGLVITIAYKKHYHFGKYRAYQYFIVPSNRVNEDYGAIPPEHEIQHDIKYFAVRLVGPHASNVKYGDWVHYKEKPDYDKIYATNPSSVSEAAAQIVESWAPERQREDPVIKICIDELPVLENEYTHDIYCIEREGDAPIIGVSGDRGCGKTWFANGLAGRAYWKWGVRPIIVNDWQAETLCWCLPWVDTSDEAHAVECKGEYTLPLPAVYLFLEGRPPLENIPYEGEVSFKISLPFQKLILDYENILQFKKSWKMERLMPRFRNMLFDEKGEPKKEFFDCATIEEKEEFVMVKLEGQAKKAGGSIKGVWQMAEKLNAVLRDIHNQNFTDNANKIPAIWTIKKRDLIKELPPWMACIYAGLVPIFVTNYYHYKDYFPLTIKYINQTIFEYQQGKIDPYFKSNEVEVWTIIDELPTIAATNKLTPASESISEIAAAGRMHRMGMVYVTQNYSLTPPRIRQTTKYMFAFNQKAEEAKEIARDYNLGREWKGELKGLKKFECVAMSNTSKFIMYDIWGQRRVVNGPIKGKVLHPLNQHDSPKRRLEQVTENG